MKIAIITAGGAGMFCGSCMQDNTFAKTLRLAHVDAVLVPTYTPIRVDEENVSTKRVFLGGINVYLDSAIPGWRRLPRWMTTWLNHPEVIRWLSRFGARTDASKLGALTLHMLKGTSGPQQREINELASYLCDDLRPDIIILSNALLSGVLSELRPRFSGKILCLLQGDDAFLQALSDRWQQPVMDQLRLNCRSFDGFLTHSEYYRDFMASYLDLPKDRIRQIPLTIDTTRADNTKGLSVRANERFRIGYFARVCPEKGVQNLLEAAGEVLPDLPDVDIGIAGYLPIQHKRWFERQLREALVKVPNRIHWFGSPGDRAEKFRIINNFNLLCVPTDYPEPKGRYVLEAGLVGVPSILPSHGVFPELLRTLGYGTLYDPTSKDGLLTVLRNVVPTYPSRSDALPERVIDHFGMDATAPRLRESIVGCID